MNLFRSEGHARRWQGDGDPAIMIPAQRLCDLAHAWWSTRLDPDWKPRTTAENQTILTILGLVGDAWRLP